MNATKTNGNRFSLKPINLLVLTIVVGIVMWLMTALGAKADQTQVNKIEEKVVSIQLTLERMNGKLDLILDK